MNGRRSTLARIQRQIETATLAKTQLSNDVRAKVPFASLLHPFRHFDLEDIIVELLRIGRYEMWSLSGCQTASNHRTFPSTTPHGSPRFPVSGFFTFCVADCRNEMLRKWQQLR